LSSTSSNARTPQKRSATEVLASRYRHLFVLPSTPFLLVYAVISSFLLGILSRGAVGVTSSFLAFVVFLLSASAISSALRIADRATIASFRRTLAVVLAGEVLWLVCAAAGSAYAWASGSTTALTNSFVFGALASVGFEFIVINGTFTDNAPLAIGLAALHPTATLLLVRLQEVSAHLDLVALLSGAMALVIIAAFTPLLGRKKTELGYDALRLFRSFMKTWVAGEPSQLEKIISDHSEEAEVESKVMRFRTERGDTFVVLPGVHPGPFHPIGSYDLPGVVSRAFKDLGPTMTLHRPGGHERNLATAADTEKYAEELSAFAASIATVSDAAPIRGPLKTQIGKATVTSTAFGSDAILTVSFAPFGSDDLDTDVERVLAGRASNAGLRMNVVDAHNSIEVAQESPELSDPGWAELIGRTKEAKPMAFRVGYAHSNEVKFSGGGDLTENGVGLLMIEAAGKSVLILADANNAVPALRAEAAKALAEAGYDLVEFCTSDSHNLAARGLTVARGYEALGEQTPVPAIVDLVVKLAKLADGRLAPAAFSSGQMKSRKRLFGARSIEEFARITQSSSKFGRAYLRFAVVSVAALLLLSLLL
jgi:putative membrane protein